jgi:chromosome segregation ATPase
MNKFKASIDALNGLQAPTAAKPGSDKEAIAALTEDHQKTVDALNKELAAARAELRQTHTKIGRLSATLNDVIADRDTLRTRVTDLEEAAKAQPQPEPAPSEG